MTSNEEELHRRIRELEREVAHWKSQIKTQRFGLNFLDIPEAFDRESEDKLPILTEVPEYAIAATDDAPTHILIEGDNYHALTCLNYTHAGKVDVIYIDPPYNTGSDGFTYRDKRVLSEYPDGVEIGKNHPARHSAWLSFMKRRLILAHNLLSAHGIIFISIDDNEDAALKLLCDEVFMRENKVADIIWQSRKSVSNDTFISNNHNYTLVYFKDANTWQKGDLNLVAKTDKFSNPDNDPRGAWVADPFDAPEVRANLTYEIVNPNNNKSYFPTKGRHWRTTEEEYLRLLADNRIVFGKRGLTKPQLKRFASEAEEKGRVPISIWNDIETTTEGTKQVDRILGKGAFKNPKPLELLHRILSIASASNSIILDFFAGSGTTLHATLQLNHEDGGRRQCILVQEPFGKEGSETNICRDITYERNRRVMQGYTDTRGNAVEGLGGSLRYYRTAFVGDNNAKNAHEDDQITLAQQAGCLIALAENTLEELTDLRTDFYQLFTDGKRLTTVYFQEDARVLPDLVELVRERALPTTAYFLTWNGTAEEFAPEFDGIPQVQLKAIPSPILEIYKKLLA